MATKTSNSIGNSRQRKQLIFVAVGGVVLLALAFIQGPKVMKQLNGSSPSATPAPATTTPASGTGAVNSGPPIVAAPTLNGSAVIVKPSPRPGAKTTVAGVAVSPWQVPQATTRQLWTFSRLKAKDPFVQQVDPDAQQQITPVAKFAGSAPSPSTPSQPKAASATTAAEVPLAYATVEVNGDAFPLKLDQRFPSSKAFKLISVKPNSVVITLATGGSIGKAEDVVLTMGKSVTLVNSATGKRFTLRLLYTGSSPEVVKTFSTKKK